MQGGEEASRSSQLPEADGDAIPLGDGSIRDFHASFCLDLPRRTQKRWNSKAVIMPLPG